MDRQPASCSVEYQKLGTYHGCEKSRLVSGVSGPLYAKFPAVLGLSASVASFVSLCLSSFFTHGMPLTNYVVAEIPKEMKMLSFHKGLKKIDSWTPQNARHNAASTAFRRDAALI
jgi:hypothetical protein